MKTKIKPNIYHAKTIDEAIDLLEEFFYFDMWYACNNEWTSEKKMRKYLQDHFGILREEIKRLRRKKK